jgi:RimJ/RimL family protein N-acetyltransferase
LRAFQEYRNDSEVAKYQDWPARSDAEAEAFLVRMAQAPLFRPGRWSQIGIASLDGELLVGDIGLFLLSNGQHAEFGISLGRLWQGRGIATAAARGAIALVFECTSAESVMAVVDARNAPAIRLVERLEMARLESRDAVFRGEPSTEHLYAIARTDLP